MSENLSKAYFEQAKVIAIVAVMLVSFTAQAAAQNYKKEGDRLTACYRAAAVVYGTLNCSPSESLLQMVFGRCASEETALMNAVRRASSGPPYPNIVLKTARENMTPELRSTIIEGQKKQGMKCP
jgi:hypothetical protein